MTKIDLIEERAGGEEKCFRALAAHHQAMGRTAGEAIDALTAQIPPEEADTLIIVRGLRGDRFFSDAQRRRLEDLMALWQSARESGNSLSRDEQAELERLIDAEVLAASRRAAAIAGEIGL